MEGYLNKLKEYTKKLHVCGERNSYSKTDLDATFMRMKEDAMGNGQPEWLFTYKKVTADAGYKSEENYSYLEKKGIEFYIKPSNYEASKRRKYWNDNERMETMVYDSKKDVYICHEGRELKVEGVKRQRTQTGYERETTIYGCEDYGGCPYKKECIKGNHSK